MLQAVKPRGMPSVRSLARGLDVLFCLVERGSPAGVADISRETGLHKATVARLLKTMTEAGYVTHPAAEGTYAVGPSLMRWLRTSFLEGDLHLQVREVMTELRNECGETVALYLQAGHDRVCIDQVQSRHALRRIHELGETRSITLGATGLAFLAFASESDVERALKARPLDGSTPVKLRLRKRFLDELATVRACGFANVISASLPPMSCLSAPIFDSAGSVAAVVTISGPDGRWNQDRMRSFAPSLIRGTRRLSTLVARSGRPVSAA